MAASPRESIPYASLAENHDEQEGTSVPEGIFVAVPVALTPAMIVSAEHTGQWAHPLEPLDFSSQVQWKACCCPCVMLARIESALGTDSFFGAVYFFMVPFVLQWLALGTLLATVFLFYLTNVSVTVLWIIAACAVSIGILAMVLARACVRQTRTNVRRSDHIPGSEKNDRYVVWSSMRAAICQMLAQVQAPMRVQQSIPRIEVDPSMREV